MRRLLAVFVVDYLRLTGGVALGANLAEVSRSGFFKPGLQLAGAGVGGVAGYAIGNSFGSVGALIGAGAGALTGLWAGDRTADIVATKADQKPVDAQAWYAAKGGLSLEEATARLSNSSAPVALMAS